MCRQRTSRTQSIDGSCSRQTPQQCSPSRHTALSSRHAGPAWLKTAYEATGLNATTESETPPSSWRNAPLAFLFADSATPAEATPAFLATARVLQLAALGATAAASAGLAYALPAAAVDGSLLLLAALPPLYMFQDTLFGALFSLTRHRSLSLFCDHSDRQFGEVSNN